MISASFNLTNDLVSSMPFQRVLTVQLDHISVSAIPMPIRPRRGQGHLILDRQGFRQAGDRYRGQQPAFESHRHESVACGQW